MNRNVNSSGSTASGGSTAGGGASSTAGHSVWTGTGAAADSAAAAWRLQVQTSSNSENASLQSAGISSSSQAQ